MEETVYTYQDLVALTKLSEHSVKRRVKRLERSLDRVFGRIEATDSGRLTMFDVSEVEAFLEMLITMGEIPPEKLDEFRQLHEERSNRTALVARQVSLPIERGSGGGQTLSKGMDELAVSRTLAELAEHQLPIRAASAGILIALFENRSRPYSPETIREWCKGRGHSFDRIGFKFTWADGAIIVSRPLI